jgi:hypothetical protein
MDIMCPSREKRPYCCSGWLEYTRDTARLVLLDKDTSVEWGI